MLNSQLKQSPAPGIEIDRLILRLTIILIVLFRLPGMLCAQLDTSVVMSEITITDQYDQQQSIPLNNPHFQALNAGQLLSSHSNAFIKSYGLGSIATMSIRGGSANQNMVLWNDVPVDNPMLGLSDLSLLQSHSQQKMTLLNASSEEPNQFHVIGGILKIENHINPEKENKIALSSQFGSFSHSDHKIEVCGTFNRLLFDVSGSLQNAKNNFRYSNGNGTDKIEMPHNEYDSKNINVGLSYPVSKNSTMTFQHLTQNTNRQIPPTDQQAISQATQKDKLNRSVLSWALTNTPIEMTSLLSWIDEDNIYDDPYFNIRNNNQFQKLYHKTHFSYLNKSQLFNLAYEYYRTQAATEAYVQDHRINGLAISGLYRKILNKQIFEFGFRKEWTTNQNSPVTVKFNLIHHFNDALKIQVLVSNKYRLPTLNELYWTPGGNLDLEPEKGWNQELVFSMNKPNQAQSTISFYHRLIQNWILWSPVENSFIWSPQNLTKVRSYGLEINYSKTFNSNNGCHKLKGTLNLGRSENLVDIQTPNYKAGQQLLYSPKMTFNLQWLSEFKNFSFILNGHYTGEVMAVNQENLQDYFLLSVQLNKALVINNFKLDGFLKFENILNHSYFIIENRPMPGTYFLLGAKFNINY